MMMYYCVAVVPMEYALEACGSVRIPCVRIRMCLPKHKTREKATVSLCGTRPNRPNPYQDSCTQSLNVSRDFRSRTVKVSAENAQTHVQRFSVLISNMRVCWAAAANFPQTLRSRSEINYGTCTCLAKVRMQSTDARCKVRELCAKYKSDAT